MDDIIFGNCPRTLEEEKELLLQQEEGGEDGPNEMDLDDNGDDSDLPDLDLFMGKKKKKERVRLSSENFVDVAALRARKTYIEPYTEPFDARKDIALAVRLITEAMQIPHFDMLEHMQNFIQTVPSEGSMNSELLEKEAKQFSIENIVQYVERQQKEELTKKGINGGGDVLKLEAIAVCSTEAGDTLDNLINCIYFSTCGGPLVGIIFSGPTQRAFCFNSDENGNEYTLCDIRPRLDPAERDVSGENFGLPPLTGNTATLLVTNDFKKVENHIKGHCDPQDFLAQLFVPVPSGSEENPIEFASFITNNSEVNQADDEDDGMLKGMEIDNELAARSAKADENGELIEDVVITAKAEATQPSNVVIVGNNKSNGRGGGGDDDNNNTVSNAKSTSPGISLENLVLEDEDISSEGKRKRRQPALGSPMKIESEESDEKRSKSPVKQKPQSLLTRQTSESKMVPSAVSTSSPSPRSSGAAVKQTTTEMQAPQKQVSTTTTTTAAPSRRISKGKPSVTPNIPVEGAVVTPAPTAAAATTTTTTTTTKKPSGKKTAAAAVASSQTAVETEKK